MVVQADFNSEFGRSNIKFSLCPCVEIVATDTFWKITMPGSL